MLDDLGLAEGATLFVRQWESSRLACCSEAQHQGVRLQARVGFAKQVVGDRCGDRTGGRSRTHRVVRAQPDVLRQHPRVGMKLLPALPGEDERRDEGHPLPGKGTGQRLSGEGRPQAPGLAVRQHRKPPLGRSRIERVALAIENRVEDPAGAAVRVVADEDWRTTEVVVHDPMVSHHPQRIGAVLAAAANTEFFIGGRLAPRFRDTHALRRVQRDDGRVLLGAHTHFQDGDQGQGK